MGESTDSRTTLRFDRRVRLEFHGSTITSDAGLLACRELDDALGLTETATACLQESRGGRNVQHQLVALLRQSVYSRLAGYEDTNDAERLAQDPAMRVIVGRRGLERRAASTNTMSRFETEVLTRKHNPEGLARMNAQWVDRAMAHTSHRRVILDMDSSKSPVHGEQEGAAYNGHFGCTCYHPIFVFNQFGDCEGAMLRPGNVHSAHNWREVLDPILSRYAATGLRRYFRADAAFAKPEVYEYLEERLVSWLNRPSDIHPVIASGIAQFQLVHIHPFLDGNGRTSRLLSTLCLYRAGYDFKRLFTISEYYDRDRTAFYRALQSVRQTNMDMTRWIEFFAIGLATQLAEVKRRGELAIQQDMLARRHDLTDRQALALRHVMESGRVTIGEFEHLCPGIQRRTLQRDLRGLIEKGLLLRRGSTNRLEYALADGIA